MPQDPEKIARNEMIAAAADTGTPHSGLAQSLGVSSNAVSQIYRAAMADMKNLPQRELRRAEFIDKGYTLAFKLIKAAGEDDKIAAATLKEIITALGIVMDKVLIASGRFEEKDFQDFSPIAAMDDDQLDGFLLQAHSTLRLLYKQDDGDGDGDGKLAPLRNPPPAPKRRPRMAADVPFEPKSASVPEPEPEPV